MTRRANRVGIPIVAGTDAIGGSAANLHAELQLLVDSAGLSPLEALRAATVNGARAIGLQDSLGTIAPGKIADLVVLRGDPSRDIRNTQTVTMVIKARSRVRADDADANRSDREAAALTFRHEGITNCNGSTTSLHIAWR